MPGYEGCMHKVGGELDCRGPSTWRAENSGGLTTNGYSFCFRLDLRLVHEGECCAAHPDELSDGGRGCGRLKDF